MTNKQNDSANPFRAAIDRVRGSRRKLEDEADRFTGILRAAMGLTEEELEDACDSEIRWSIGDYIVVPELRLGRNWRIVLEVVPKTVFDGAEGSLGYSNIPHPPLPEGWTYVPKGTRTILLPPDGVRKDVVRAALEASARAA